MSHFKAKIHQILFPASVRSSVRPFAFIYLFVITLYTELQRRRHSVTTAIVVDVVGASLRPSEFVCADQS